MNRREFAASLAAALIAIRSGSEAAEKNISWALSLALWGHLAPVPFTEILDIMKDTGFTGIRMTSFPGCLKQYNLTIPSLQRELDKRGLRIATISFGGPADDRTKHEQIEKSAREALGFLKEFGATELVVFSPARVPKVLVPERIHIAAEFYNHLGDVAKEYGFRAGLHNHLDQLAECQDEVEMFLKLTDPKRFGFAPDTAHLHLSGCNVAELFEKYADRLIFMDYKDSRNTPAAKDIVLPNGQTLKAGTASATFMNSIYDLGDGEVNFPRLHRILKRRKYKGWICVDLDYVRASARESFGRCMKYVREKLEPIYV
ncbi:MAG TPA: TIM barrel protein [Bryobacterales bacterium]|jgi:inosose dehydratase|nr:TIM barrel protein [Bryobacterales bacterium]